MEAMAPNYANNIGIATTERDAIWAIVRYLEMDEGKDHEERGEPDNHILRSVKVLSAFMQKVDSLHEFANPGTFRTHA